MAKNNWLSILFLIVLQTIVAQDYHLVYFKNKAGTIGSLDQPNSYLSEQATLRRSKQQIALDSSDLPVSETYIKTLVDDNWEVVGTTKWLNGALVKINSGQQVQMDYPFVKTVKAVKVSFNDTRQRKNENQALLLPANTMRESFDYGNSLTQINLMGAVQMHEDGYRGETMRIAVLDAGFSNVKNMQAFSHLWENNKVLDTYDFHTRSNDITSEKETHGTSVLSLMAAKLEGSLIGVAPEANYLLYRTEVVSFEYPLEEVYWVMAAERADSAGADLINSSLGYTDFDNPNFDYSYSDLNGNTSIVSFGAKMAARKGMLVCNSAGNYGARTWRYINTPADTDSILTVGSVNSDLQKSSFSSFGPTADGRIKPDLVAMGQNATYALTGGGVSTQNGTSFSSPLVCGLAAGVWQANPEWTAQEVIKQLKKSGHNSSDPNNELGWGVPNYNRLKEQRIKKNEFVVYSNPLKKNEKLKIRASSNSGNLMEVRLYSVSGKLMDTYLVLTTAKEGEFETERPVSVPQGIYIIKLPDLSTKRLVVFE